MEKKRYSSIEQFAADQPQQPQQQTQQSQPVKPQRQSQVHEELKAVLLLAGSIDALLQQQQHQQQEFQAFQERVFLELKQLQSEFATRDPALELIKKRLLVIKELVGDNGNSLTAVYKDLVKLQELTTNNTKVLLDPIEAIRGDAVRALKELEHLKYDHLALLNPPKKLPWWARICNRIAEKRRQSLLNKLAKLQNQLDGGAK